MTRPGELAGGLQPAIASGLTCIGRDGRRQRGGPDAPCPPARYAALLLYLRIRPAPLPACAPPGFFVEDSQGCRSGMRGDAIAEVKEEDRVAGRGTRSNCVTPCPTAVPICAQADLSSRPLLAETRLPRQSRRAPAPAAELLSQVRRRLQAGCCRSLMATRAAANDPERSLPSAIPQPQSGRSTSPFSGRRRRPLH
jgi:hypothetical protein